MKIRDKRISHVKVYYENNREKIKVSCECGCTLSKAKLIRHKETKRNNDLMNIQIFKSKLYYNNERKIR